MKGLPTRLKSKYLFALLIYHVVITIFAYFFILSRSGDAEAYWFIIKDPTEFIAQAPLPFREHFLYYINYVFAIILKLPFWFGFLLYSIIGFCGIYYIFKIIRNEELQGRFHPTSVIVLLLPSIHFWTSIIGKEPICFLSISLVFYSLNLKNKIKILPFIIGISLLALIRPHVVIILASSILLAYIIKKRKIKVIHIASFIAFTGISLFFLLRSHWLQGLSIDNLQQLFQAHHDAFRSTDTYVPLENYNLIYRIFTFYYRPLPIEFDSMLGWITGLENLLSLLITFAGVVSLWTLIRKHNYRLGLIEWGIVFFFISLAIVLTLAYSNFGLISRMKNQSLPFWLMLCLNWIGLYYNKKHEKT